MLTLGGGGGRCMGQERKGGTPPSGTFRPCGGVQRGTWPWPPPQKKQINKTDDLTGPCSPGLHAAGTAPRSRPLRRQGAARQRWLEARLARQRGAAAGRGRWLAAALAGAGRRLSGGSSLAAEHGQLKTGGLTLDELGVRWAERS